MGEPSMSGKGAGALTLQRETVLAFVDRVRDTEMRKVFALVTAVGSQAIFSTPDMFQSRPLYPVRPEDAPRYFLVAGATLDGKNDSALKRLRNEVVYAGVDVRPDAAEVGAWYPIEFGMDILELSDPRWADGVCATLPYGKTYEIKANPGEMMLLPWGVSMRDYADVLAEFRVRLRAEPRRRLPPTLGEARLISRMADTAFLRRLEDPELARRLQARAVDEQSAAARG